MRLSSQPHAHTHAHTHTYTHTRIHTPTPAHTCTHTHTHAHTRARTQYFDHSKPPLREGFPKFRSLAVEWILVTSLLIIWYYRLLESIPQQISDIWKPPLQREFSTINLYIACCRTKAATHFLMHVLTSDNVIALYVCTRALSTHAPNKHTHKRTSKQTNTQTQTHARANTHAAG